MIKEKKKEGSAGVYIPLLIVLLLVAVFFVGRLSSQVEMMGGSGLVNNKVVDSGEVIDQGEAVVVDASSLKEMASELSLNQKDFDSCLDEGKYEQRVKDDVAYGGEVGVSGTPSFFINGIMLVGAQPIEEFEKIIDGELNGNGVNTERIEVIGGIGAVRGGEGASVKIVEFSDFECPYCASTIPTIDRLFEKYGDKISAEYRHFPLGFHANAQKMAEASECAGEQGKFWEMHDLIFGSRG